MNTLWVSLRMLLALTLLTGVAYPLALTGLAQLFLPGQANGSLIKHEGRLAGSECVGQSFTSERYFWPRPSAVDYNPLPSGGSNLGPTSQALLDMIAERRAHLASEGDSVKVPPDLLLASGSGLDPHISPEGAFYQMDRVLRARGAPASERSELAALVRSYTEGPQWGLFGEPRVNVLRLNLALDSLLR
jgi:potassium-transporting ATPase KdpC subunit